MDLSKFSRLNIPAPPALEAAIGYENSARYVALYVDNFIDQPMMDDGIVNVDMDADGWVRLIEHPRVRVALGEFGASFDGESVHHFLMLDRHDRSLFVGDMAQLPDTITAIRQTVYSEKVPVVRASDCESHSAVTMTQWLDHYKPND